MATIRQNVEHILELSTRARNDDKYLMARYWHDVDKVPFPMTGKNFVDMATSPASIIRARALIQADGLYPSDAHVAAERAKRENDMRNAIAKDREVV